MKIEIEYDEVINECSVKSDEFEYSVMYDFYGKDSHAEGISISKKYENKEDEIKRNCVGITDCVYNLIKDLD